MKLSEIICNYRIEHKMSQRQFAKKCGGLSNGYVSMLENDFNPATQKSIVPSLDKLKCIAQGMDMTLNELLDIVDDMPVELLPDNASINIAESRSVSTGQSDEMRFSSAAIALARLYDTLDERGQRIVDAVVRLEAEHMSVTQPLPNGVMPVASMPMHMVPNLGKANCTGSIETRHAAKQEVAELEEAFTEIN